MSGNTPGLTRTAHRSQLRRYTSAGPSALRTPADQQPHKAPSRAREGDESLPDPRDPSQRAGEQLSRARTVIGGFFLCMAGVHVGLVAAEPEIYRPFADQALFGWVQARWADIFMAAPALWGLAVAAGELTLGALLLAGGRGARLGYAGIVGFHLALMLFGWGFWVWSVPALALVIPLARSEFRRVTQESTPARVHQSPGNRMFLWLLQRGVAGKGLCALRVSGRRSGRLIEFPVRYAARSRDVVIAVGRAEAKTWWLNFEQPHPVEVLLARRWVGGLGRLVLSDDRRHGELLELYRTAHPRVSDETGATLVHIRLEDVEPLSPE